MFVLLFMIFAGIFYLISAFKVSSYDTRDSDLSQLLEILSPPEINYDRFPTYAEVIGMENLKKELELVKNRFNPENNQKFNRILIQCGKKMDHPKGFLFYGPPGTGKTYLAKAFARESKMNFYTIMPSSSMKEIENIFKKARQNSPSIVFVDEAEEVLKSRTSEKLEEEDAKKTNLFLTEIDGVKTDKDNPICFIAATNHLNKIDDAIKSRLDAKYIGYLDKDERIRYLNHMANNYKFSNTSRKYFNDKIIPRFQDAADNPEKYALMIRNKFFRLNNGFLVQFQIPSISKSQEDIQGKLFPAKLKYEKQELKNKFDELFKKERVENQKIHNEQKQRRIREYELSLGVTSSTATEQQTKIDQFSKYLDDSFEILNSYDEEFEKIKEHFSDILSNRKLDSFLLKTALIAGNHGHTKINISDLEEASEQYFGPNIDYLNENQSGQ